MTTRLYHTVVSQESKGQEWAIEFGSFSKAEAKEELQSLKDSGQYARVRILTTQADQNSINAARKALPL